ncbi:MAG: glutathione S-transferase family protein [Janthinobacterium lividum]
MTLQLYIGNKAYSSWSLRPWILLKHFGVPFDETVIPMYRPETRAEMLAIGPTGKVPVLHDGGIVVSESLAIIEFIAESFPDRPIWPSDRAARALARAMSSEMHAGFMNLRQTCPTNFRRAPKAIPISPEVRADVDRIEAVWADARARFGHDGPFLFGAFSAADAMYAPVVNRLHAYAIPVRPETRAYMEAVMALPAWQSWIAGGEAEPWRVALYDDL